MIETKKEEVKIGGEEREFVRLPLQDEDGKPAYYRAVVKGYRKKPGRPNDAGEETWYYSWTFEVTEPGHQGVTVWGSTNDEARRAYTTKKPLKLLQLIMAVNGGVEPQKGEIWSFDKIIGNELIISLEEKSRDGESYQQVVGFYSAKKGRPAPIADQPSAPELPEVSLDGEMTPEDATF